MAGCACFDCSCLCEITHNWLQVVITPCETYMPWSNEKIAAEMHKQVQQLFPSARQLTNTWHSVVKIQQSLYRCA